MDILLLLLRAGADPNMFAGDESPGMIGQTPLMMAVSLCFSELDMRDVEEELEYLNLMEESNEESSSSKPRRARSELTPDLQALVDSEVLSLRQALRMMPTVHHLSGAVDTDSTRGNTVLDNEHVYDEHEVIVTLLEGGADPDLGARMRIPLFEQRTQTCDITFKTMDSPLKHAISRGYETAAQLLLQAGADVNNLYPRPSKPTAYGALGAFDFPACFRAPALSQHSLFEFRDMLEAARHPGERRGQFANEVAALGRGQLACFGLPLLFFCLNQQVIRGVVNNVCYLSTTRRLLWLYIRPLRRHSSSSSLRRHRVVEWSWTAVAQLFSLCSKEWGSAEDSVTLHELLGGHPALLDQALDAWGNRAVHVLARNNRYNLLSGLLSHGADPDARNADGATALHLACQRGHSSVVAVLLEASADCNAVDRAGQTAVILGCHFCHANTVQLVLKAGADPDAQDVYSTTALMRAADRGQAGCASGEMLLAAGADVNVLINQDRVDRLLEVDVNGFIDPDPPIKQYNLSALTFAKDANMREALREAAPAFERRSRFVATWARFGAQWAQRERSFGHATALRRALQALGGGWVARRPQALGGGWVARRPQALGEEWAAEREFLWLSPFTGNIQDITIDDDLLRELDEDDLLRELDDLLE